MKRSVHAVRNATAVLALIGIAGALIDPVVDALVSLVGNMKHLGEEYDPEEKE